MKIDMNDPYNLQRFVDAQEPVETVKKSGPTLQFGTLDTSSGTPLQIRCSGPSFEPAVADVPLSASISSVVFSPSSC